MNSKFPERLKNAREMRKWSRMDLSTYSGVDNSLIGRYEKGLSEPTASSLIGLAQALDVSTDYLLGLTNEHGESAPTLSSTAWAAAQLIDSVGDEVMQKWALKMLATALDKPEK